MAAGPPSGRQHTIVFDDQQAVVVEVGDRGLPTGRVPVAESQYDFRTQRKIGQTELDLASTRATATSSCSPVGSMTAPPNAFADGIEVIALGALSPDERLGAAVQPGTTARDRIQGGS